MQALAGRLDQTGCATRPRRSGQPLGHSTGVCTGPSSGRRRRARQARPAAIALARNRPGAVAEHPATGGCPRTLLTLASEGRSSAVAPAGTRARAAPVRTPPMPASAPLALVTPRYAADGS